MLKGQGWINLKKYGCKKQGWQKTYVDLKVLYRQLQPQIIRYPVANYLRFDRVSQLATLAIALALCDAKIAYSQEKKQPIGILGTNTHGALEANLAYFNDYIANGRTLARGNLFIYTLPSSFLAETAIHFGLTGGLLYLNFPDHQEEQAAKFALNMLKTDKPKTLLLVNADSSQAACSLLQGPK